jgi:antirestriction protein ArdC
MTDKIDILREQITNNIIELMEKNTGEWLAPFAGLASMPTNANTGEPYSGLNAFYLALLGETHWATFNQWNAMGANDHQRPEGYKNISANNRDQER